MTDPTELRRLLREGTPGPWTVCDARTVDGMPMVVGGEGDGFGLMAECTTDANAALITAAVNALPGLLDRVEALEWFGARKNLSLDFHYEELEGDGDWTVHRISGNINDREWEIVGQGETPFDAIQDAARALSPSIKVER